MQYIELGQRNSGLAAISGIPLMVFESVGPFRHAVNVPFHDSQARGKAILIYTRWDQRWGTDAYWESGPYLHEDFVFRLIRSNVRLVGVDFPDIGEEARQQLRANGIAVVENLCNLKALPCWGARFCVEPAGDRSRAYAEFTT